MAGLTVVRDPEAWRLLAHPTRRRLILELKRCESARVVDLAEWVGEPANVVSFHLRKMADYGFVERVDAPDGNRRERWWRSTNREGFRGSAEELEGPDAAAAAAEVEASYEAEAFAFLASWFRAVAKDEPSALPPGNFELWLDLTPQERREFQLDMGALFARWRERTRAHGHRPGASTLVVRGFSVSREDLDTPAAPEAPAPQVNADPGDTTP